MTFHDYPKKHGKRVVLNQPFPLGWQALKKDRCERFTRPEVRAVLRGEAPTFGGFCWFLTVFFWVDLKHLDPFYEVFEFEVFGFHMVSPSFGMSKACTVPADIWQRQQANLGEN